MALKKKIQSASESGAAPAVNPGAWARAFPLLWEHLTQSKFDDGEARQTSTITVTLADGLLKAALKDRANGLVCWASGVSWEGLWASLEEQAADDGSWRKDRFAEATAGKSAGPKRK